MRVGEVIDGKYELVRELGKGGMSAVFEGRHVHIGSRSALKFLNPEVVGNPSPGRRLHRLGPHRGRLRTKSLSRGKRCSWGIDIWRELKESS